MIENIRLTPTQALELAQDAQVLRWDIDTKPWDSTLTHTC